MEAEKERQKTDALHTGLKALGNNGGTTYSFDKPTPELLEKFPNPFMCPERNPAMAQGSILIETKEFSSLCPLTKQPDWATIIIDYIPNDFCVESKSLKLYLGTYRNFGEFHESCICRILNDLVALLDPIEMTVKGEFAARGGIPFWPTAYYNKAEYEEICDVIASDSTGSETTH